MSWRRFEDECARRRPRFWWRDDDAGAVTPELKKLLDLSRMSGVPLGLAVVPDKAEAALFRELPAPASVIQHGTDHRNRAAAGEKKTEYPRDEPMEQALARIADGHGRLRALAGPRLAPVLAPPWNRVRSDLLRKLPGIGIRGISAYGPRASAEPAPALRQVNTHVDIVAWREGKAFVGEADALSKAIRAMESDEPVGWLTHHAVHDAAAWAFIERLLTVRDIRWLSVEEAFCR